MSETNVDKSWNVVTRTVVTTTAIKYCSGLLIEYLKIQTTTKLIHWYIKFLFTTIIYMIRNNNNGNTIGTPTSANFAEHNCPKNR